MSYRPAPYHPEDPEGNHPQQAGHDHRRQQLLAAETAAVAVQEDAQPGLTTTEEEIPHDGTDHRQARRGAKPGEDEGPGGGDLKPQGSGPTIGIVQGEQVVKSGVGTLEAGEGVDDDREEGDDDTDRHP